MRKIKINPKYEYLRDFIESIPDIFEKEGKEIYHQRNIIKALPNFDVEIFKQCTGITIESEEQENGTNETSEGQIHRRS